MKRVGEIIRSLREEKGEPLRVLAAYLHIDQAVMSKIERGLRNPTKAQVEKIAKYFKTDKKQLLIALLSDRIVKELEGETLAKEALAVAEQKVLYKRPGTFDRNTIIRKIRKLFDQDGRINKAWIFGSFARGTDGATSDIDIMVEENKKLKFSYFDLADIQYRLEQLINRKIDIGFSQSLKEHAAPSITKEAVLIYEKS